MFSSIRRWASALQISSNSEEVIREQFRTLTHMIPFLYTICVLTAVALMATFMHGGAPSWLAFWLPGSIALLMAYRRHYWIGLRGTDQTASLDSIIRTMRSAQILGPVFTLAFSFIGIGLIGTADAYQQSLSVVAIWITAIASAFCLSVLPTASILVVICSATPLIGAFLYNGAFQMLMLAGIFTVVSAMMVYMLHGNFTNFSEILNSRHQLALRQRQTEAAHRAVTRMAYTDTLTDLPNRRAFERLLNDRVSSGTLKPFIVGILDLDGFKPVNDAYGHAVGDDVLIEAGRRLSTQLRGVGTLARMGGDEFALIVDGRFNADDINHLALRLRSVFDEPIIVGDVIVRLSCSFGFSTYPDCSEDAGRLIDRADMALYRAKADHNGSHRIFDASYERSAIERAIIEQDLREAIRADALQIHFQPIINLTTGRLSGFEALARWTSPRLGPVSPAVFVPIAEQCGLIEAMTNSLLLKAARVATRWPSHLRLAFNMSAYQIDKPGSGLKIISILAEAGLPPHRFEAEITETAILKNVEASRVAIELIKAAGARVALDDFGTGFSSLSHVKDLPLDKIKIDRSFVDKVCTDEKIGNIVRSIIQMCECLDIECVAEGIEHDEHLAFLIKHNCTSGQGFLFSRPLPETRIPSLITEDSDSNVRIAARDRAA